ncbi:MAG TPA: acyl carrier protein [Candidatus Paceibacterota bacterium]|nr:acyl carrier protein [Candidatus Paceibacterota bacterium]
MGFLHIILDFFIKVVILSLNSLYKQILQKMKSDIKRTEKVGIFKLIVELLIKNNDLEEEEIKPESNFVNDLGLDSLDLVELTVSIEKELQIKITDEELEKVYTVQDLMNIIENKQ